VGSARQDQPDLSGLFTQPVIDPTDAPSDSVKYDNVPPILSGTGVITEQQELSTGGRMKLFTLIFFVMMTCGLRADGYGAGAEEGHNRLEGPYLVIEGYVKQISARILILNDQQYPLSIFARVFDTNGNELSVQKLVNAGKIDRAKVYILKSKIEKIIVQKNI